MLTCKRHLSSPASTREMAALLLGRLLTRPDTAQVLREFLAWSATALSVTGQEATFRTPGTASLQEAPQCCEDAPPGSQRCGIAQAWLTHWRSS